MAGDKKAKKKRNRKKKRGRDDKAFKEKLDLENRIYMYLHMPEATKKYLERK
ncbi:MAG: hypothetical protein WBC74_05985 [Candidatus Omnitrophota bacterium]